MLAAAPAEISCLAAAARELRERGRRDRTLRTSHGVHASAPRSDGDVAAAPTEQAGPIVPDLPAEARAARADVAAASVTVRHRGANCCNDRAGIRMLAIRSIAWHEDCQP